MCYTSPIGRFLLVAANDNHDHDDAAEWQRRSHKEGVTDSNTIFQIFILDTLFYVLVGFSFPRSFFCSVLFSVCLTLFSLSLSLPTLLSIVLMLCSMQHYVIFYLFFLIKGSFIELAFSFRV